MFAHLLVKPDCHSPLKGHGSILSVLRCHQLLWIVLDVYCPAGYYIHCRWEPGEVFHFPEFDTMRWHRHPLDDHGPVIGRALPSSTVFFAAAQMYSMEDFCKTVLGFSGIWNGLLVNWLLVCAEERSPRILITMMSMTRAYMICPMILTPTFVPLIVNYSMLSGSCIILSVLSPCRIQFLFSFLLWRIWVLSKKAALRMRQRLLRWSEIL